MSDKIDREDANTPEQKSAEVVGVQFPTLDSKDLPKEKSENQFEDIPMDDDVPMVEDIPMLEEMPKLEEDETETVSQNWLQRKVAQMDDVQFRRAQTIAGIVVALIAVVSLFTPFRNADGSSSMWGMVIAMALALMLPRIVERKIKQPIMHFQKVLVIVMIIGLVAYGVYAFSTGAFNATEQPAMTLEPTVSIAPSATSTILP